MFVQIGNDWINLDNISYVDQSLSNDSDAVSFVHFVGQLIYRATATEREQLDDAIREYNRLLKGK